MALLDWSQCTAVESIPGKVSGAWVFRGTRVPVAAIFENLKTSPIDEVLENFHVTREQILIVLDFAARSTQPHLEHVGRMKIILDESVPQKLRLLIEGHAVVTTWFHLPLNQG